jgi:flagellar motor switch protein FliN
MTRLEDSVMNDKPVSPEDGKDVFEDESIFEIDSSDADSLTEDENDAVGQQEVPGEEKPESGGAPDQVQEGSGGDTVFEGADTASKEGDDDFDLDEEELNIEGIEELVSEGVTLPDEEEGAENPIEDREKVNAVTASFPQLQQDGAKEAKHNIDLLLDISLPLVVELGRTRMYIEEILKLHAGSVVPLDKVAGEPANILINDKVIAKGEVVVIDENFGIRITSLLSPIDRLQALK